MDALTETAASQNHAEAPLFAELTTFEVKPTPGLVELLATIGPATCVQTLGGLLLAIGIGLWVHSVGAGIAVAGTVLVLLGIAVELGRRRAG